MGRMRIISMILVAACTACSGRGVGSEPLPRGAEADARDYVGSDALVDYATLSFVEPAERDRFDRARACFAQRASAWEHYPLRMIGSFVEEDWCRGPRAELGCSGGGFREQPDTDWAEVGTLHYRKDWPQVFGVQVGAGHLPAKGEWGAWFSVSTNGKSILGDGGSVGFTRVGDETSAFYVGTSYSWEIGESVLFETVQGDGWALLDRVRSSPRALRDEAITHWTALETKVIGALERGEVLECVYGEYTGGGIPPECLRKVPISAQKVKEESARIRAKVAGVRAAFESDGQALHEGLMALAPTGCP